MSKLAFIFRHPPYGSASAREGLDALLAATAFCEEEEIAVFFFDDGLLNLLHEQQPEQILQKDTAIEQRYVCADSLQRFSLTPQDLLLDCRPLPRAQLLAMLQQSEKILTF